jgi:hypothetical protein
VSNDEVGRMKFTVKTTIVEFETKDVEVEVPSACPHCGASFEEDDALLECGWMAVEQAATLAPPDDEGEGAIDSGDDYRDFPEVQMCTGWRCAGCRVVVVGEEC